MLTEKEIDIIKNKTEEFFNKAGSSAEVDARTEVQDDNDVIFVNISTPDSSIFIGKGGVVLADIQLLLRKIVKKALDKEVFFNADIDGYKEDKIERIKEMARSAADEVLITKKEKILPPLSSFARRIVHTEIANKQGLRTESIGIGDQKRIIVREQ